MYICLQLFRHFFKLIGLNNIYHNLPLKHQSRAEVPISLLKTKVRIISKDLYGLFLCRAILNPMRFPLHAWGLISHKLLRWLVPYWLVALVALNLLLMGRPIYNLLLLAQLTLYALAAVGYVWQTVGKPPGMLRIPFSFCLVNLAALVGVARFAVGKRSGQWNPVRQRTS